MMSRAKKTSATKGGEELVPPLNAETMEFPKRKAEDVPERKAKRSKGPHPGPFFFGNLRITNMTPNIVAFLDGFMKDTLKEKCPMHAEVNFYPDRRQLKADGFQFGDQLNPTTDIPLHCDRERKKVCALRVGAPMYVMWVPFYGGTPGLPVIRKLHSGDFYIFDMAAAGWIPTRTGWRVPTISEKTLYWKHAAGRNLHNLVGKWKKLLPYLEHEGVHKLPEGHTWTLTFSDQVEHNTQGGTFGELRDGFTYDELRKISEEAKGEFVDLAPQALPGEEWTLGDERFKASALIVRGVVDPTPIIAELQPADVPAPPRMAAKTPSGRQTVSEEGWEYCQMMNSYRVKGSMLYDLVKLFGNGTTICAQRKRLCGVMIKGLEGDIPSSFNKCEGSRDEYLRLQREHTARINRIISRK